MPQSNFEEILKVAGDELVELSSKFYDDWGTKLRLGHTDWLIENSMVRGESHEKYTPAHTYFASVRELYTRSVSMEDRTCMAMEAQADLLDALEAEKTAEKPSEKLRVKAKIKRAECQLKNSLISIKDLKQEMKCLYAIMKRHEPLIEKLYQCDIEKAQPDMWKAVMTARLLRGDDIKNVPLPLEQKAVLSAEANDPRGAVGWEVERRYMIEKGLHKGGKLSSGDMGQRRTIEQAEKQS